MTPLYYRIFVGVPDAQQASTSMSLAGKEWDILLLPLLWHPLKPCVDVAFIPLNSGESSDSYLGCFWRHPREEG